MADLLHMKCSGVRSLDGDLFLDSPSLILILMLSEMHIICSSFPSSKPFQEGYDMLFRFFK